MGCKVIRFLNFLCIISSIFLSTVVAGPFFPVNNDTTSLGGNIDERGPYTGGDMIIPPSMFIQGKSGIIGNQYRWTKGQIPFVLDQLFSPTEVKTILDAFNEIQSKTCIRFVQRTEETDYIRIVRGTANSGCWSFIGKQGGGQTLNLQPGIPGCIFMGIVAHELIHAIGYFHEHSRTDRDNYVRVHWENIKQGFQSNFDKYALNKIDSNGVDYDYNSIMHYGGSLPGSEWNDLD